jgi:hypothetical protein
MNRFNDSTATNVSLLSEWAYAMLRPIVRILRAAGVSQATIVEGVRRAGAQHAADKPNGRIGSGTRYESVLALGAVTGAWGRSSDWTDGSGNARELSLLPEDTHSFVTLIRSVDPKLNPAAALKELQQLNVVKVLANPARVRLLRHTVVHADEDTFSIEPVLRDLQRFAETVEHNVFHKQTDGPARMQMSAARVSIDPARFADFERFAARNGQVFLDSADDRLNSFKSTGDGLGASYGVGLFVFFEGPTATPVERNAIGPAKA